jgi:hypothetical protein
MESIFQILESAIVRMEKTDATAEEMRLMFDYVIERRKDTGRAKKS